MSGSIVNTNGSSSITITNLIDQLQSVRRGMDETSLTNYSTTAIPSLAAGSICEVAGSIYRFSTQESVSTISITSTANFTYFVELVPSSSTITAQFSSTVPAWREDYNGFYLSTASNHRVIAEMEKDGASTLYWYKRMIRDLNREREKTLISTFSFISTEVSTTISHHLTSPVTQIRAMSGLHNYPSSYITFQNGFPSQISAYSTYFLVGKASGDEPYNIKIYITYV